MEGGEPLAGDRTRGSRGSFTAGGRRCTVAGEDFEEPFSGQPDAKPLESFSNVARHSFEKLKEETLLDPAYVEELEQELPGHVEWLRSSMGLLIQVGLFLVYVSLDCSKTIFNSMALKGELAIVSQSISVSQSFLQVILGLAAAFSVMGQEALPQALNRQKIVKFLPVSCIFAVAQSFNALSYTVLSGGTIKILGQVRLLQTALLSKFVMGRSYQLTQWTVIGLIVMAAANFCLGKEDDKIRWACYRELQENRTIIPQACIMGSEALDDPAVQKAQQSMTMGFIYVFTYLILSDCGSIMCERLLKDEDDTPYYLQKTWMEIGSFPCALIMSFVIPLGQQQLGVDETRWKPQMWWTQDERCADAEWAANGTNMNYCGGFFRNWTFAAVVAICLWMSHSFVSGLVVKKLNSVVKLMGKCASLALVFFVGDCWLLRKQEPSIVCMVSAIMVMTGTFTFMNLKPPKEKEAREAVVSPPEVEMRQR